MCTERHTCVSWTGVNTVKQWHTDAHRCDMPGIFHEPNRSPTWGSSMLGRRARIADRTCRATVGRRHVHWSCTHLLHEICSGDNHGRCKGTDDAGEQHAPCQHIECSVDFACILQALHFCTIYHARQNEQTQLRVICGSVPMLHACTHGCLPRLRQQQGQVPWMPAHGRLATCVDAMRRAYVVTSDIDRRVANPVHDCVHVHLHMQGGGGGV